jgi:hypothetical protein
MRLLDYLDNVWSDIWDLIVMEVNELRSIIPHSQGRSQEIKEGPNISLIAMF